MCHLSSLFVTHVLWLSRMLYAVRIGTIHWMDRVMTSLCRLTIVTMSICSGLAAILNAKLLPAASHSHAPNYCSHVLALIVAFDIASSP